MTGDARVRVARHPHVPAKQEWGPWSALTSETNYHLHEAIDGDQVEWIEEGGKRRSLRNKHEVLRARRVRVAVLHVRSRADRRGAPQARRVQRLRALADVIERPEYAAHREALSRFDEMVDTLSLAKASGSLVVPRAPPLCAVRGRRARAGGDRANARRAARRGGRRREEDPRPLDARTA
ncbi:MAG: hypothetical protein IPG04_38465 [Polyangiaceae bacterium]|nr:hypothetical protein [Polyangiaceae bacterium]